MTKDQAYREYVDRQTGKSKPDATFYPNTDGTPGGVYELHERQPCCTGRDQLWQHARTATHVAHIYGLDPEAFSTYCNQRRRMETMEKRRR